MKKGQSTLEYVVLVMMVIVSILVMQSIASNHLNKKRCPTGIVC